MGTDYETVGMKFLEAAQKSRTDASLSDKGQMWGEAGNR
jgi:hypothetical protein